MAGDSNNPPGFPPYLQNEDEPPPPPPPVRELSPAAVGGWLCFSTGILAMHVSLWTFWVFVPLFFMAFMFSVVAMSQGNGHHVGLVLLVATLTAPAFQPFIKIGWLLPHSTSSHSSSPMQLTLSPSSPPSAPSPPPASQSLPAMSSADREVVEKIYAEPLSEVHAWQIQIAHTQVLATGVAGGSKVTFSTDGESIMYPRSGDSGLEMVVSKLRDHSIINSWKLAGVPANYDWSPDGKRVAYITDGRLHIVDLATPRDVALPPVIQLGNQNILVWTGAGKIATGPGILDIETLETTAYQYGQEPANLRAQYAAQFGTSPVQTLYTIVRSDGSETNGLSGLFVNEQDGSYKQPLVSQGEVLRGGIISPDRRHIFVLSQGVLVHHYLGVTEAPQMTYRIGLNSRALLKAEDQKQVDGLRQKGMPFWGRVYSPLVNTLNDRVVGPYPNTFKGIVKLTDWHDSDVTVTVSTDLTLNHSIHEGDIVTDIACGRSSSPGSPSFSFGEVWLPLQSMTSPQAAASPTAAQGGK